MSTTIARSARVHETAHIGENVWIGPDVEVGANCRISPGVVIGSQGFGYDRPHSHARWEPKDHDFGVVIEDDVMIHANAVIHRGSWRPTRVRRGSRIDSLAFLAHNVEVGRDCMIVAHAMLAGSVKVCDGAWIGPGARVNQRLTIGERALLGTGCVVLEDVPADQTWAGVPARCIDATQGIRDVM